MPYKFRKTHGFESFTTFKCSRIYCQTSFKLSRLKTIQLLSIFSLSIIFQLRSTCLRVGHLVSHERICTAKGVAEAMARDETLSTMQCAVEGCYRMFRMRKSLLDHQRCVHEFPPTACSKGCAPGHVYTNLASYQNHMHQYHSGRWPALCRFPACKSPVKHVNMAAYSKHLHVMHGLTTKAQRAPWLPAVATFSLSCTPSAPSRACISF